MRFFIIHILFQLLILFRAKAGFAQGIICRLWFKLILSQNQFLSAFRAVSIGQTQKTSACANYYLKYPFFQLFGTLNSENDVSDRSFF